MRSSHKSPPSATSVRNPARENVIIVRRDEAMRLIKEAKREGGLPLPDEFEETETGYTCLAQYVARAIALGAFGKSLRRDDKEE